MDSHWRLRVASPPTTNLSLTQACDFKSDWVENALTVILIVGIILSYVPQNLRIIRTGTSVGFSPWFLLLGSTSSAAAMFNMITLQYPVMRCCAQMSPGKCIEQTAGVVQVAAQWLLFDLILVLYMVYYPPNLKYTQLDISTHDARLIHPVRTKLKSTEWRLSVVISWIVFLHLAITLVTTIALLVEYPPLPDPNVPHPPPVTRWATFLGVTSAFLAAVQYAPQLMRTYHLKLVGALSIPMMVIQSPGGIVMAVSIAMRPGTDWTSWVMYAVSAVMQAGLLAMCIAWKIRQRRLGIDDFGRPLGEAAQVPAEGETYTPSEVNGAGIVIVGEADDEAVREDTPLLKPGNVMHRGGLLGWIQGLGKSRGSA